MIFLFSDVFSLPVHFEFFAIFSYCLHFAKTKETKANASRQRTKNQCMALRVYKLMETGAGWIVGWECCYIMCDSVLFRFFYACVYNCQIWNLKYISVQQYVLGISVLYLQLKGKITINFSIKIHSRSKNRISYCTYLVK